METLHIYFHVTSAIDVYLKYFQCFAKKHLASILDYTRSVYSIGATNYTNIQNIKQTLTYTPL